MQHNAEVMMDLTLLELDRREKDVVRAYLELVLSHRRKEGRGEDLHKKRSVQDPFYLPDVLKYYEARDLPVEKRKEVEKFIEANDPDGLFIPIGDLVKKIHRYAKWSDLSFKRISLEMTRAAHRLVIRGFAVLFVGTPKFSDSAICISIEKVRAAAERLNEKVPSPPPAPDVPVGLLHATLDGDRPPFDGTMDDLDPTNMDMAYSLRQERYDDRRSVTSLSNLSREELKIIEVAFKNQNRVTLPWVVSDVKSLETYRHHNDKALYMRLYRAARSLNTMGLAQVKKGADGLLWIEINKDRVLSVIRRDVRNSARPTTGTDLIKGNCKIPTSVIEPPPAKKSKRDIYSMPKNARGYRRAAIRFMMGVKMLDYSENRKDREKRRPSRGPYHDAAHLMRLFNAYSDESVQKIIVLMNRLTGETIGSDYSTRFNDVGKGIERLKKFEFALDKSLHDPDLDFEDAVFLTLTTDPNRFPNLYHANRNMGPAWNHFIQALTVKIGGRSQRPKYICACEYTKTGLLHLHILLFGRTHLFSEDKEIEQMEISKIWQSCGQGKIVKAYALKNTSIGDGKREWRWIGKKQPADSKGRNGGDYLKKYLKKCLLAIIDKYEASAATLAPYWVLNKRFFTCSQCLLPTPDEMDDVGSHSSDFFLSSIEYGIDLDTAYAYGHIDRIGYRRADPDNFSERETEREMDTPVIAHPMEVGA